VVYRKNLIITIDGPSGAGKSTIAKMLAQKLGYSYIDTGAMYRGVAYAYKTQKNNGTIADLLAGLSIRFEFKGETRVLLDGVNISKKIRDPEISLLASFLSQQKIVREYLYKVQRGIGKNGGVVLEGRDTGSVVFPNAQIKFYLDADPEERAKRRHIELTAKGAADELAKVKEDMIQRDKNDSERDIAPLVMPEGATYIDTTGIDIQGVLTVLLEHVAAKEA
jgi:cytidylate kinase